MPRSATSYVKLTRVASPRHHPSPSWKSLPARPGFREQARQACVCVDGLCRRRRQAAPGNYPAALIPCGRAVPTSRRHVEGQEGKITAPRSRGKSGRGVAWYCGPGCRPSVLRIRALQYNHPREGRGRETIAIVAPAAPPPIPRGGLGFPSFLLSPPRRSADHQGLPIGPAPGPPRRGGLRPARARGMRPVPSVDQWGMEPRLLLLMLGKGNLSSWINVLPPQARQLYMLLFAMAWQT